MLRLDELTLNESGIKVRPFFRISLIAVYAARSAE